jgi:hypothetical protein
MEAYGWLNSGKMLGTNTSSADAKAAGEAGRRQSEVEKSG